MAIKVRDYSVRLTRSKEERKQVRQLRYRCFAEEEGMQVSEEQKILREEYDSYDRFADYMGVFHGDKLVGTYRIIDRAAAEKMDGFYTETEFDLKKIKKIRGNIAEMSRACVAPEYRENGLVMRMLWMGLGEYILKRQIVAMFGIASFVGVKPAKSAMAISYLYYNNLSPLSMRAEVLSDKMENPKLSKMNILPREFVDKDDAYAQMPPLLKGYLRLGATFGKGVFVHIPDNSYEVSLLMQTKNISRAYQKHFAGSETAFEHLGIKDSRWKTFGKFMLSPIKMPITVLKAVSTFFLREEDARDVEFLKEED